MTELSRIFAGDASAFRDAMRLPSRGVGAGSVGRAALPLADRSDHAGAATQ
jgi:hypothetical protein